MPGGAMGATVEAGMNARDPIRLLLVLLAIVAVEATLGAVVGNVAPAPDRAPVKPHAAHILRTVRPRPARQPGNDEMDITAYVNLYALAGVLVCFVGFAYWGRWQTHNRCPSCGYCPAWCRCGEVTHRHSH